MAQYKKFQNESNSQQKNWLLTGVTDSIAIPLLESLFTWSPDSYEIAKFVFDRDGEPKERDLITSFSNPKNHE